MSTFGRRGAPRDLGSVAVEFVLLLPMLLALIGLVVGGARVWWTRTGVQQLASSAARAASIARTAGEARATAESLVRGDAVNSDLRCMAGWPRTTIDTSGFAAPLGTPARVTVRVSCTVPLSDLLLPGLPGSFLVEADAQSPLDRYRMRRP